MNDPHAARPTASIWLLSVFASLAIGCGFSEQWLRENCTPVAAYASGTNDGRIGDDRSIVYENCPAEVRTEASDGYRAGYIQGRTAVLNMQCQADVAELAGFTDGKQRRPNDASAYEECPAEYRRSAVSAYSRGFLDGMKTEPDTRFECSLEVFTSIFEGSGMNEREAGHHAIRAYEEQYASMHCRERDLRCAQVPARARSARNAQSG